MQGTRKISYASVSNTAEVIEVWSAASTWGELKQAEPDISLKSAKMKAMVRPGPGVEQAFALTSESQVLPAESFVFVFLVDKNDSGNN